MTARTHHLRPLPSVSEWLALVAGLYFVLRYAWLMDDAFVYFRYADNFLLLKAGLVYNPGEYVEGYSSPLWMLLMTTLRALRLNWWLIVRMCGVLAFVSTWWLMIRAHRELSPQGTAKINLPLLFVSCAYGPATHFTGGLETPLMQLAAAGFALYLVRPESRTARGLVVITPLIRHDLTLAVIAALAWVAWRQRRVPWRLLLTSFGLLGTWVAFRVIYYAELVPNTYFLKNTSWTRQGLVYVWQSLWSYSLPALLVVAAIALTVMARRGEPELRWRARLGMIVVALPGLLYVIRIGGDFLHYRYTAFAFVLMIASLGGLFERGLALASARWPALAWHPPRLPALFPLGLALLLAWGIHLMRPPQIPKSPHWLITHRKQLGPKPIDVVHEIEDAMHHRWRPELDRNPWESGAAYETREEWIAYRHRNPSLEYEMLVADFWCVRNYDHYSWYVVHSLGLTDAILSRADVPWERPGHRWNLHPLGQEIAAIRGQYGHGEGVFQRAAREGNAPDWIVTNLRGLSLIESKIYNRHRPWRNLELALSQPRRIQP